MNTDASQQAGLMSLTDVAQLADVRRPVVSMWRKRYAAAGRPFPAPVACVEGVDRFSYADVVGWLELTGRGNNRRVAAEARLHGAPPIATPACYRLCEALLTVSALSGELLAGLDQEDVTILAEDVDPDDRCLLAEIAAASEADVPALAAYVDALLDASYGGVDAAERLRRDRSRFGMPPEVCDLSEEVRRFVVALAGALAGSAPTTTRSGTPPWRSCCAACSTRNASAAAPRLHVLLGLQGVGADQTDRQAAPILRRHQGGRVHRRGHPQ